jgi:Mn-dependent DtxR family transcriptional regulator
MVSRVAEEGTRELHLMSEASQTPLSVVEETAQQLQQRGMIDIGHGLAVITPAGQQEAERLLVAQRQRIQHFVDNYPGSDDADVEELLDEIARRLHAESPA